MSEITPIERFLGPVELSHGPFGLLGLAPADYDAEMIREALRSRLLQLSRHRQAASAEADEVRLALHVAAAQLSDPEVRRLILDQQGVGKGEIGIGPRPVAVPGPVGPASSVAGMGPSSPSVLPAPTLRPISGVHPGDLVEFQEVALRVLAHSGGWNEFAKRRLGALAHAYGLDMVQLRHVLKAVAHERSSGGRRREAAGAGAGARNEARVGAGAIGVLPESWRRAIGVATVVLFVLTGVMGIWLVVMLASGPGKAPERTITVRSASQGGEAGTEGAPDGSEEPLPAPDVPAIQPATSLEISSGAEGKDGAGTASELLEQLRNASAGLRSDPSASVATFLRVLQAVGERWTQIDPPTLQALRVELSNFQLAAIRADRNAALATGEAIAKPASGVTSGTVVFGRTEIAQAAFSAGLMARLNRDDLISSIGSQFRNVLVRLSADGSGARYRDFWPGVALGLDAIARQYITLASDREKRVAVGRGWSGWIEALERLRAEDAGVGQQLLLDTIERTLIEGPDPAMSQSAHDALSRLVAMMDFVSSDSRAPQRLIMWFDDSRVPTSGLSLVTSRIVFSSLIPGFGPEMMLRPDAPEAARSQLRDDYALKLGLPVSSEDRAVSDLWRARAREVLDSRPLSEDAVAALERAGVLAMLNASATLRWAGDDTEALRTAREARVRPMVDNAVQSVQSSSGSGSEAEIARLTSPSKYPDGAWARRYLAAMRNAGARQELLNELRNSSEGPRGPVDADVLCEAACYGGPVPLRRSAQSVVVSYAENLGVINGLLEALPNAARTVDVSEMIQQVSGRSLPSTRDPAWRAAARAALLERMVEMLGRRMLVPVEALEHVIRQTYEDRCAASGAGKLLSRAGGSGVGGGAPTLSTAAAAQLAGALRDEMATHARQFSEGRWTFTPLNELEQKHQARVRLAHGGLQEFAAEQLGLTEVMAYVVAAERASKADDVRSVLRELAERRREAPHIFHQIEAAEEAMLRLWLIRLGEEGTA